MWWGGVLRQEQLLHDAALSSNGLYRNAVALGNHNRREKQLLFMQNYLASI
jgi:hypothetical protein